MACSVLMSQQEQPLYFPLLDSPLAPGIRNLQLWIEDAWMHGQKELLISDATHIYTVTRFRSRRSTAVGQAIGDSQMDWYIRCDCTQPLFIVLDELL